VIIFFFASAGASAAYLTVSEIFPQEVRAKAIAVFFSIAQIVGALATSSTVADQQGHPTSASCSSGTSPAR